VRNVRVPFQSLVLGFGDDVPLDHDGHGFVGCGVTVDALVTVPKEIELPLEVIDVNGYRNGDHGRYSPLRRLRPGMLPRGVSLQLLRAVTLAKSWFWIA
jgi:hypothetical protein